MSVSFVGRKEELAGLAGLLEVRVASLVVVKGRRRVGKSRLIEQFAKPYRFLKFTGLPPTEKTTLEDELREFARQLSIQTGIPEFYVDDWSKLFYLLSQQVLTGRVIILFDEISWMGSKDHLFLGKLKTAWDDHFKKNWELIFVLCGSVSAWIEQNILSSTGFLGRITYTLTLEELPLHDCNQFWLEKTKYISAYEKFKLLSVTGGIPSYLERINPSLTAEENIRKLCFVKSGYLVDEFNKIFSDLFSRRSAIYKAIVKALLKGPMEIEEIAKVTKKTQAGALSEYLDDLVESGFVRRDYTWHLDSDEPSKLSRFRLRDNYVRFYLKYIDRSRMRIEKGVFDFQDLSFLPGWDAMMGLQFENLVLNNSKHIFDELNLPLGSIVNENPFFQRATKRSPGCQIDYLIQTKHRTLYVCEIKFSRNPIGIHILDEMQQKIDRFAYPKGFSIRPVLVHVNGVDPEVARSGYFSKIIDFGSFLE